MNYKKLSLIFLSILILLTSSFFRFNNLNNWGLFIYDEGQYINEAKYFKEILLWSNKYLIKLPFSSTKAKDVENMVEHFPSSPVEIRTGRPLHTLLLSLGFLNSSNNINAGSFVVALFGTLTVVLTFILAFLLTNSITISFISSFLLSINPLHIFYSRTSMADADSTFFFILALIFLTIFYKTRSIIHLLSSGLNLGLAYVTNGNRFAFYTVFLLLPFFIQIPAVARFVKILTFDNLKALLKISSFFFIAFIIPIILAELPYYLAFLFTHNLNKVVDNPTYLEQVIWLYTRLFSYGAKPSIYSLIAYPYIISSLMGISFFVFLICGFYFTLKTKVIFYKPLILIPTLITLGFSSIHILQPPRAISPILPLISIIAAIGIYYFVLNIKNLIKNFINKNNFLLIVAFLNLLILADVAKRDFNQINYRSQFNEVITFLNQNNIKKIASTNESFLIAYNPDLDAINYQVLAFTPKLQDRLNEYPFIVTNNQKYTISTKAHGLSKKLDPVLENIENNCQPVFTTTDINSDFIMKIFILEHNFNFPKTYEFLKSYSISHDSKIKVYNYNNCFKNQSLPI